MCIKPGCMTRPQLLDVTAETSAVQAFHWSLACRSSVEGLPYIAALVAWRPFHGHASNHYYFLDDVSQTNRFHNLVLNC